MLTQPASGSATRVTPMSLSGGTKAKLSRGHFWLFVVLHNDHCQGGRRGAEDQGSRWNAEPGVQERHKHVHFWRKKCIHDFILPSLSMPPFPPAQHWSTGQPKTRILLVNLCLYPLFFPLQKICECLVAGKWVWTHWKQRNCQSHHIHPCRTTKHVEHPAFDLQGWRRRHREKDLLQGDGQGHIHRRRPYWQGEHLIAEALIST